jgi:hypothetical protein
MNNTTDSGSLHGIVIINISQLDAVSGLSNLLKRSWLASHCGKFMSSDPCTADVRFLKRDKSYIAYNKGRTNGGRRAGK